MPVQKMSLASDLTDQNGSWPNPTWVQVSDRLNDLRNDEGTVSLSLLEGNPYGIDHLEVRFNGREYVMNYLLNSEEDAAVYSFSQPRKPVVSDRKIDILGDFWAQSMVASDFSYVFKYFKDFWETGKVSLEHFS